MIILRYLCGDSEEKKVEMDNIETPKKSSGSGKKRNNKVAPQIEEEENENIKRQVEVVKKKEIPRTSKNKQPAIINADDVIPPKKSMENINVSQTIIEIPGTPPPPTQPRSSKRLNRQSSN
jgi:hypothetical protein